MATKLNEVRTAFDAIKLTENEKIKVWDVLLSPEGIKRPWQLTQSNKISMSITDGYEQSLFPESIPFTGRVRILAVMNKKPDLLTNIRFSVAWCAPSDLNRYTRVRANAICVGRWNKTFANIDINDEWNIKNKSALLLNHTGIIEKLDTLKGFVEEALTVVEGHLPQWVHHCIFDTAKMAARVNKEYINV